MHHEFAVESYEYHSENFGADADFLFIRTWCLEPEMLAFAEANCNDKTRDIIATIKGMTGYRKPTAKQKAAIALAMLEGRTAKDILVAVYGDNVKALLGIEEVEEIAQEQEAIAPSAKSELFKAAWAIARTAAAAFGGSVKSYFAESLKLAYSQHEAPAARSNEEKLLSLGLKVWEKGGYRRIYFSKAQLENLFDFDVEFNNRGFVSFAKIQGEKISNSTASEWLANAGYYDCNKNKFVGVFAQSKRLANILEMA